MLYVSPPAGFNPSFEIVSCFCQHNGSFLLLKRMAGEKVGAGKWGVPAGKMKKREKAINAVIREVKEETGIKFKPDDLNYFDSVYVKYSDLDFIFHMFYTELEERPQIALNSEEHNEYDWAEPHEALQMDLMPDEDKCVRMFFNL